ncbi:hypothetical protein [Nevskia soli]|uniref:hypothetical protein n=1 Tax=Nevskia soli TaxID=418856 RepID=UPI0004A6DFFD|nr:hypothetical protein [Nevskia soli]
MLYLRAAAAAIAAACLLSGCAGQPEVPFDHSANTNLKTIAVLTPSYPSGPGVVLASTVGQSFGLVGALVDGAMQSNRESKFSELLSAQKISVQDTFMQDIGQVLQAQGYQVVLQPVTRDKADFLSQYPPAASTHADLYLDMVVTGYGYIAAGVRSSTPYRPAFSVRCKLVRASDGAVLMEDTIAYNPLGQPKNMVTIAPDADYVFKDFDTLMADPDKAGQGLKVAMQKSTDSIGLLLR